MERIYKNIIIKHCGEKHGISVCFNKNGIGGIKAYCFRKDRVFVPLQTQIVGAGIDLAKDTCAPWINVACTDSNCPHNTLKKDKRQSN